MYPEGSKYPYEITRRLLAKMAPVLAKLPNRVRITGHTTTADGHLSERNRLGAFRRSCQYCASGPLRVWPAFKQYLFCRRKSRF